MAGKVISIEIGYSLTRVCEVDYKAKSHRVYRRFTMPTPEGVINDGMLRATPEYIEAFKKELAGSKMAAKQVMFTITSGKIASREVMVPLVKENRIADVVVANASEYFPVDLSQYELAYNILGIVGEEKGSQQYKLLVMAAPQTLLDGYYELAKALNLELAAIDYAGNSIFQVAKDKAAHETCLVVKIDERSTLVMAVQNSMLTFTRNVSYGVDDAIQTIMESTRWANTDTVVDAMDAMSLNDCTVFPEIIEALEPLAGGISRVVDYYASHNTDAPVEKIYITGIGADIKGMVDFLSKEIGYAVEPLRQVEGWNLEKSFRTQFYGGYVACVGAAAAPLGFKKDEKKKSKGKAKDGAASDSKGGFNGAPIAYTILALGIVAGVALAAVSVLRFMEAERQNMELRARNSSLEAIIPIYNEYVATQTSYNLVQAMYSVTENRNEELVEFLEELEDKLPANVHVVNFTSNLDGIAINMNVSTKSEAAVAIEQLRTFNSLYPASVTVNSIVENVDEESGTVSVNFSVAAIYRDVHDRPEELEAEEAQESTQE
ncbi:MAG: pilus assembly protein PilM [Lachnospiraceae bacterium]|nr:pilus assembly protein PilM [Lachnospiraceae bacterium]